MWLPVVYVLLILAPFAFPRVFFRQAVAPQPPRVHALPEAYDLGLGEYGSEGSEGSEELDEPEGTEGSEELDEPEGTEGSEELDEPERSEELDAEEPEEHDADAAEEKALDGEDFTFPVVCSNPFSSLDA